MTSEKLLEDGVARPRLNLTAGTHLTMSMVRALIAVVLVGALLFGLTGEPLRAGLLVAVALLLFLVDRVHLRRFIAAREHKTAMRDLLEKTPEPPLP